MKDEFYGKRIVILGLARQGKALARFASKAGAEVVASDLMPSETGQATVEEMADLNMEFVFGDHPLSLLDDADILAISGGVPSDAAIVIEAQARKIPITNDSLEFVKRSKAEVIGITGSAGKTTTTALTGSILRESGRNTWIGGNIGRPLISEVEAIQEEDAVVQELSSFQLEFWTESPDMAAVLNITPNHLDRHGSMEIYSLAKANILRYQKSGDVAVLSADDEGAAALLPDVKGRLREFSLERPVDDGAFVRNQQIWLRDGSREWPVLDLESIPLSGRHNISNVLASSVLADSAGVPAQTIKHAVSVFEGVSHRLEKILTIDDVLYINDSIATAPERAIAAIQSFKEPIILLAGGRDKDMVWDDWARQVTKRVKAVIVFGDLADLMESKLRDACKEMSYPIPAGILREKSMEAAVHLANRLAIPGDVVLLSPGGTSFDAFTDFAERGDKYREIVHDLVAD